MQALADSLSQAVAKLILELRDVQAAVGELGALGGLPGAVEELQRNVADLTVTTAEGFASMSSLTEVAATTEELRAALG